jgi:hypothetical protein
MQLTAHPTTIGVRVDAAAQNRRCISNRVRGAGHPFTLLDLLVVEGRAYMVAADRRQRAATFQSKESVWWQQIGEVRGS